MPSVSKKQQKFFGMASAYQDGKLDTSNLSPEFVKKIKSAAESMTAKQVDDFAKTKHKELPEKIAMSILYKVAIYLEKENLEKTAGQRDPGHSWYSWMEHEYFPMFGKNDIYEAQMRNRVKPDWQRKRFQTTGDNEIPADKTNRVILTINDSTVTINN
jgi:hypothetical protein